MNSQIDYDADVVAQNEALEAQEAWEEMNAMENEPVVVQASIEAVGELNQYGDTMPF